MADELKEEHRRLSNRIRQQLWRYYPQAIELGDDQGSDCFLDLWALAPTPSAARRLAERRVARVLAAHRIRRMTAAQVMEILQRPALTVAPGTEAAAVAHIGGAAERVRLVNRQLKAVNRRLDAMVADFEARTSNEGSPSGQLVEQRDATILRSLPGVGRTVLATLLGEATQALRSRDYHALRTLCGVAPVTKRSGKSRRVEMRQACSCRLREALYHWARVATQHDPVSRVRYSALRSRGHSHGRALRSVADRLLAVACAMLKTGTPFIPGRSNRADVCALNPTC